MSKKDIIDYVMETPGNTNKKVLGRLIDEVEGVKLPEVTEDDNGDVLTVVEGAWDKAAPSGGSGGAVIFTVNGIYNSQQEAWEYTLAEDSPFADIAEHATAGDPMFLRAIKQYAGGVTEVHGVYPMSKIGIDYPEPDYTPTVSAVDFGTTMMFELSPNLYIDYEGFKISSDGTVAHLQFTRTINNQ